MSRVRWMVHTDRKATVTSAEMPYRKAWIRVSEPFSEEYEGRPCSESETVTAVVPDSAAAESAAVALQRVGDGHRRGARFSGGRVRGGLQIAAVTADQQGGADRVLGLMGHGAEGLEGHVPDGGVGVPVGGHGPRSEERRGGQGGGAP